jgi:SOS-response transcriptional repressor LexA
VLKPANPSMVDLVFRPDEVTIYGKVVSLIRRY